MSLTPSPPATTAGVTVVITTCDRPLASLRRAVDSVAMQATQVELVVVDDSTTPWVEPQMLGDVVVHRTAGRIGVNRARNAGLRLANHPWVCFLDDDDELAADFCARSLQAIRSSTLPHPVGAVVACEERGAEGSWVTAPRSSMVRNGPLDALVGLGALNGFLVPTEVLRAAGGWPEELAVAGLTDVYCRLRRMLSLEAIAEPLYIRRHLDDPTRLSRQWPRRAVAYEQVVARNRDVLHAHPELRLQWLMLRSDAQLRAGNWAAALRHAARAFHRAPGRPQARQLARALVGPRAWQWERRRRARARAAVRHAERPAGPPSLDVRTGS